MAYRITILYDENRNWAEAVPACWSRFRWDMRGTQYGQDEINEAFYRFRRGWAAAYSHQGNYTFGSEVRT